MATAADQRVTTSTVLWGDVCQSVDPDPQTPYPIYTFGGRKEFVEPYRSPAVPMVVEEILDESGVNAIATQDNRRVVVE